MAATQSHRGPDNIGIWTDEAVGIALGHSRLSILDLSASGNQPMISPCGRYVIIFNGEIYNHLELRKNLGQTQEWRGHSDTETLLAGISAWGIKEAVNRSVGMFAFAVWDRRMGNLILARDRFGEKPLYYGWHGNTFLFGSELKAIRAYPGFKGAIDRQALILFLRYGYVPAPYSIYENIHKLSPGMILTLSIDAVKTAKIKEPEPYWSFNSIIKTGQSEPYKGNEAETIVGLEQHLNEAISKQMIADVSLGAFLSGGVDSSTIVALMQKQSIRPVKTFTIGFHEHGFNEAEHAKAVARHLGTEHTELYLSPQETLSVIPKLPEIYDEPFSDSSQIPTYLVSQLASQNVKVSLSGDAGDELFAGYNRYVAIDRMNRTMHRLPVLLRKGLGQALGILPSNFFQWSGPLVLRGISEPAEKIRKLSEILQANTLEEAYLQLISHWKTPVDVVIDATEPLTIAMDQSKWINSIDFIHRIMHMDSLSYLPDDILVKVDRAAMSVSLETRTPFLDHRVAEYAWRLPISYKIRNGQGKWILRQILYKYVPRELIERPKKGFSIPIASWIRGPLREWAEELLNESRIRQEGYFRPEPIRRIWKEHLSGRRNWQNCLWDILMFQQWLESQ